MSGEPYLDAAALRRAFVLLDRALARRGVVADVSVFGGAAMILAYDARRATRDADSLFAPDEAVRRAAEEVAVALGLGRGWLNQQASTWLPRDAWREPGAVFDRPVHDGPNLRVAAMNPRHLLAMKVLASRPGDVGDIALLARLLELTDVDAVGELFRDVYGDEPLPARARSAITEALALDRPGGEGPGRA